MTCTRKTYPLLIFVNAVILLFVHGNLFSKNEKRSSDLNNLVHPQRIIVKFSKPDLLSNAARAADSRLDSLNQALEVSSIKSIADIPQKFPTALQKLFSNLYLIEFDRVTDISEAIEKYQHLPIVEFAEPDYVYFSTFYEPEVEKEIANFSEPLDKENFKKRTTTIAILAPDASGLLLNSDILWQNSIGRMGKKGEINKFVGDFRLSNFDLENGNQQLFDLKEIRQFSGLAMASVIERFLQPLYRHREENYPLRILPLQAGMGSSKFSNRFALSDILQSLIFAAEKNASVIVLPFWGYGYSKIFEITVTEFDSLNCIFIAPVGEENSGAPLYPAAYQNVLAVSAVKSSGGKIASANYGDYVDLCASGELSPEIELPDSLRKFLSPTILATQYVATTAALMQLTFPDLSPRQIRQRLIFSSDNIYTHDTVDFQGLLGAGKLNPERAFKGLILPNIVILDMTLEDEFAPSKRQANDRFVLNFKLQNLSADAHEVRIRPLVSDGLIQISNGEIFIEKLGYGETFSSENNPVTFQLPAQISDDYQPQIILKVETREGFGAQRAIRFRVQHTAPKNFRLKSGHPVTLNWNSSPDFIGYRIYRRNAISGGDFQNIAVEMLQDTIFVDKTAENGVVYEYYVTGVDESNNESLASNLVKARFVSPPDFSFEPSDSILEAADSVQFKVSVVRSDSLYALRYLWFFSDSLVGNNKQLFLRKDDAKTLVDTVRLEIRDTTDTVISEHLWVVNWKQDSPLEKPRIVDQTPQVDTTIVFSDSILLSISISSSGQDSLQFIWFLNDSTVQKNPDSFYLFAPNLEMEPPETLRVACEIGDTVLSAFWVINWDIPDSSLAETVFSLESDTTIFLGDTLLLEMKIPAAKDSAAVFCWGVNGKIDSSLTEKIFSYFADSTGIDTIFCRYSLGDSASVHRWIIIVLKKNEPPEIKANYVFSDTTILAGDTLEFFIDAFDSDGDSLIFDWQVNGKVESFVDSSHFVFFKPEVDSAETDTISLKISDADTSVELRWIVHILDKSNHPPEILAFQPDSLQIILQEDSCKFIISCFDGDGDSLLFRWSVNDSIVPTAIDSSFWFENFHPSDSLAVIKVEVSDGIDTTFQKWEIRLAKSDSVADEWCFLPEADSVFLTLGDSLIFGVENADSGAQIFWQQSSFPDSVYRGEYFIFKGLAPFFLPEIVTVRVEKSGEATEKRWFVFLAADTVSEDSISVAFYPEADSVFVPESDSVKFEIQIEGFLGTPVFHWRLANEAEERVGDSSFVYFAKSEMTSPETLRVAVQLDDSTFVHQWTIFQTEESISPPEILFPTEEQQISEFDYFVWQPDSDLYKVNQAGEIRFVVQLSADSSFSEIFSSDTVQTTRFSLSQSRNFDKDKLVPGKSFFWRIRAMAGAENISQFARTGFPIIYTPEFSEIGQFNAEIRSGEVLISWSLAYRGKCKGFNIYRKTDSDGDFVKINESLISGEKYFSFSDKLPTMAKDYVYKLEEISLSNRKKEHQTIRVEKPIPHDYSLSQNSPNPFNSSTSFRFEIPRATHVLIEVYNILGKKVKTLVDDRREAGFYVVYWDGIDDKGENVGSGIYFYYMSADQFHATHKMIVVR